MRIPKVGKLFLGSLADRGPVRRGRNPDFQGLEEVASGSGRRYDLRRAILFNLQLVSQGVTSNIARSFDGGDVVFSGRVAGLRFPRLNLKGLGARVPA
jgi:hypothetical protein